MKSHRWGGRIRSEVDPGLLRQRQVVLDGTLGLGAMQAPPPALHTDLDAVVVHPVVASDLNALGTGHGQEHGLLGMARKELDGAENAFLELHGVIDAGGIQDFDVLPITEDDRSLAVEADVGVAVDPLDGADVGDVLLRHAIAFRRGTRFNIMIKNILDVNN